MKKTGFYGWKLLAAFWIIYLVNLGFPTYGSTIINPYMAADLHLDRKMLGLAYSIYQMMVGLPGPLVALVINRIGVRLTLLLGSLTVLVGALSMATIVHTGWQAVVGFGIVVGFGSAAGATLATQTGISRWFTKRRAFAIAVMYSSGGVGGFIAAPFLDRAISSSGGNWRIGWWVIVILACVSASLAALYVKERPADIGQFPDGAPDNESTPSARGIQTAPKRRVYITEEEWTCREAFKTRGLILLLLASLGISTGYTLFMAHGVVHLKDLGHSSAAAAMSISILVFCTLLGKLAGGMGDRLEPRYILTTSTLCFGAGLILASSANGPLALYPYAILLGFGWGSYLVSIMTLMINYFGPKPYPAIVGIMLAIQTSMGAVAPVVAGYMYDKYGSYTSSFYTCAGMCFCGAILILMAAPPRRVLGTSYSTSKLDPAPLEASSDNSMTLPAD